MADAASRGLPTPTGHSRPITGARIGPRALIAAWLLRQGKSIREVARLAKLSTRTVLAVKHNNLLDPELAKAIEATYDTRVLHLGEGALTRLEDPKTYKSPARAALDWKIAKESRELRQPGGMSDTDRMAEFLAAIGARRATVISRVTESITQIEPEVGEGENAPVIEAKASEEHAGHG